ncbi:MAG: hypothetical protein HOO97_09350 [Sideroxydans sp.]|nr:hypothetical protein [Sideroxydans sp.]
MPISLLPRLTMLYEALVAMYASIEAWALANPLAALLGVPTALNWLQSWAFDRVTEIDSTSGFADKRASWTAWFDYQHNANSQMAEFLGYYIADKLNSQTGAKVGDAFYFSTIPIAEIINWATVSIGHDIAKGGGLVLNGQTIQGLRTGNITSMGFAAKGKPAAGLSSGGVPSQLLSDKAARLRLLNRERQAKFRKTHKRRSTWVAK